MCYLLNLVLLFLCLDLSCEFVTLSYNFQGAVAKRRSNFKGDQFPVATNVAHKAATAPPLSVRRRGFNAGRMTSANQSRSRYWIILWVLFVNLAWL